jgi:hypothetical protein
MTPRPLRSKQPAHPAIIGQSRNQRNEVRGLSAPIGVCVTSVGSRELGNTSEKERDDDA